MAAGRGTIWAGGLVTSAALAVLLPWDGDSRVASGLAILEVAAASALVGEAVELRALARDRRRMPRPPEGARPPDGVVEIAEMTGVEAVVNEDDPRWRRFVRLRPGNPMLSRRGLRISDPPLLG